MRWMLFIIFILIVKLALAQPPQFPLNNSGNVEYSNVIEVPSASAIELLGKAKIWLAENYSKSEFLIDELTSTVVIQAISPVYWKKWENGYFEYTLKIETKDGKYRYSIFNFYHKRYYNKPSHYDCGNPIGASANCEGVAFAPDFWNILKANLHTNMTSLCKLLDTALIDSKSNNW